MDPLNDELPEPLARAMKDLEAGAARAAARVNAARVAEGVLARLREGTPASVTRPFWGERWVRIAAAAALLTVGGAVALRMMAPQPGAEVAVGVPDSLSASQAEALLSAMDSIPAGPAETTPALVITMDDLNETELRALLQSMDAAEGVL